jgi:hypothetical protein
LKVAANEGIDLMKFSVKKNRSFHESFFAGEDTWMRVFDREFRRMNVSGARRFGEASQPEPWIARKSYTANSIGERRHAG